MQYAFAPTFGHGGLWGQPLVHLSPSAMRGPRQPPTTSTGDLHWDKFAPEPPRHVLHPSMLCCPAPCRRRCLDVEEPQAPEAATACCHCFDPFQFRQLPAFLDFCVLLLTGAMVHLVCEKLWSFLVSLELGFGSGKEGRKQASKKARKNAILLPCRTCFQQEVQQKPCTPLSMVFRRQR